MFADVRQLIALAYEGYTDSEGNVFSGDRGSFDITDKFSGIKSCRAFTQVSESLALLP
jgi:hypothetical protein